MGFTGIISDFDTEQVAHKRWKYNNTTHTEIRESFMWSVLQHHKTKCTI